MYVDKMAHSVLGAWGSVHIKAKACLQVWSMYVQEFLLMKPVTQAGCLFPVSLPV